MDGAAPQQGLNRVEYVATIATFATGLAFVGLGFVAWFTALGRFEDDRVLVGLTFIGGGWLLGALAMKWDDLSIPRTLALAGLAGWWLLTTLADGEWWTGDGSATVTRVAVLPTVLFPVLLVLGRLRRRARPVSDE
jgi:hypothetical protein